MTQINQPEPNKDNTTSEQISLEIKQFPELTNIAGIDISPSTFVIHDSEPSPAITNLVKEALSLDIGNGAWTEIDEALQAGYFKQFKDQVRAQITARFPNPAEGPVVEQFRAAGYIDEIHACLLYTSPSPRDKRQSRMPSSA